MNNAKVTLRLIELIQGPDSRRFDPENRQELFSVIEIANIEGARRLKKPTKNRSNFAFTSEVDRMTVTFTSLGVKGKNKTTVTLTIKDKPSKKGQFNVKIKGSDEAVAARDTCGREHKTHNQ